MEKRRLLITGCGRSGTLYATEIWRALGLDIRHERPVPPNGMMGADGMSSWFMAADDPEPPSGPSALDYEFDVVIHQVRHPLKVIASMAQFILREGKRAPAYIQQNAPETQLGADERHYIDPKHQLILKASRYWYHWNLLAEAKADATVKIEDLNLQLPHLCDLVGIDYGLGNLEDIPEDINARHLHIRDEPWIVDWEEIKSLDTNLYEKIRDLAASYGYEE